MVLGITIDGNKDILGIWIGEHESSEFWLSVLNDLKSRGVRDIYLLCVDGLKGFQEAISARASKRANSAPHHPSNMLQYQICRLQGY